jgi:outer membrane protein TolC
MEGAENAAAPAATADPDWGAALLSPTPPAERQIETWDEAKRLMERHQPALDRSMAAVTQAEAAVGRALAQLLPQLQGNVGAEYNTGRATSFTSFAGDLVPGASVALAAGWSVANLRMVQSSRSGLRAERQELAATRHALLGTLSSTLLGVVAAQRVADRNRAGLAAALERLHMTERLVELGRATALDLARFTQDLYEVQGAVVSGDEALWQAREALGSAFGLGEPVSVAPGFEPSAFLRDARASGCEPLSALSERAQLRAAQGRERRAEAALSATRSAYLPELQLSTSYSAIHAPLAPETDAEWIQNVGVTASLAWTVFDGGQRRANMRAAHAELTQAQAEHRARGIAAQTEYRRAQRLVIVARTNLEIATHNLDAAQRADALSRKAFELGNASALEGVDAAKRLRTAEITLALRGIELAGAQIRAHMALAQCR